MTTHDLTWRGDPTILVYAVRHTLGRQGSHAPLLVALAVVTNRAQLTGGTRQAIVRDITAWLDTVGADAPTVERAPWLAALKALGITRPIETLTELRDALPPVTGRRAS